MLNRSMNMNLDRLKYLDELFTRMTKEGNRLKGCSFAIYKDDKKLMDGAYGTDSLKSIYKIYSMTKPITAVAALKLYEQGLIDMFDPVYEYLPAYKDVLVYKGEDKKGRPILSEPSRPILVRDLFNMTSGLPYPGEWSYPEKEMQKVYDDLHQRAMNGEKMTNLSIINEWVKAPLLCEPGERWIYGTSADVLAGIVEVVSSLTLGAYLKKYIFDPLNMKDTGFLVDRASSDRLATMYYFDDDTGVLRNATAHELVGLNEYAPFDPPFIESGGGGLYSTLKDYSKFARMLTNEGTFKGERILSPQTVRFMSENQLTGDQIKTIYFDSLVGYGYGNLTRTLISPSERASNAPAGEYGWDGLAGTYFFVDPVYKITYVFMQQIAQGGDESLRRRMKQIIYGSLEE